MNPGEESCLQPSWSWSHRWTYIGQEELSLSPPLTHTPCISTQNSREVSRPSGWTQWQHHSTVWKKMTSEFAQGTAFRATFTSHLSVHFSNQELRWGESEKEWSEKESKSNIQRKACNCHTFFWYQSMGSRKHKEGASESGRCVTGGQDRECRRAEIISVWDTVRCDLGNLKFLLWLTQDWEHRIRPDRFKADAEGEAECWRREAWVSVPPLRPPQCR